MDARQELLQASVVNAGSLQVREVACLAYALQHRLLAQLPARIHPEQSFFSFVTSGEIAG
jgi:hypothetical protein